jgi:hypothetical protein
VCEQEANARLPHTSHAPVRRRTCAYVRRCVVNVDWSPRGGNMRSFFEDPEILAAVAMALKLALLLTRNGPCEFEPHVAPFHNQLQRGGADGGRERGGW